jgi:hypothetical protein
LKNTEAAVAASTRGRQLHGARGRKEARAGIGPSRSSRVHDPVTGRDLGYTRANLQNLAGALQAEPVRDRRREFAPALEHVDEVHTDRVLPQQDLTTLRTAQLFRLHMQHAGIAERASLHECRSHCLSPMISHLT